MGGVCLIYFVKVKLDIEELFSTMNLSLYPMHNFKSLGLQVTNI